MLSDVQLENYKSFKKLDNLKIKPITVLCGANSCGKSSILQSILLLKQTKESRTPNNSILLNGNYVHLGDVRNIIHGHNPEEHVSINYKYEFSIDDFYKLNGDNRRANSRRLLSQLLPKKQLQSKKAIHQVSVKFNIKPSEEDLSYIKTATISDYEITVSSKSDSGKKIEGALFKISTNDDGATSSITWNNLTSTYMDDSQSNTNGFVEKAIVRYENLFPLINIVNDRENEDDLKVIPFNVYNFLRLMHDFLQKMTTHVSYIGPLREEPSRRYIYENEVLEIGSKGENAAYIYQTQQNKKILNKCIRFDDNVNSYIDSTNTTLHEEIDYWMNFMGISGFKPDFQSEIIRLKMEANSCSNTHVNIADVGFGVSQIFPILIEGLRMSQGGTLLLEQPEIHLHPALQMKMADYFISLALSGKRIILETHSDHIVNRLIRRIIENSDLDEMVSINFVSSSDSGAFIEEVKVDPLKGIVNWPDGFFDQTANEQEQIMLAAIKRRKLERNKNL